MPKLGRSGQVFLGDWPYHGHLSPYGRISPGQRQDQTGRSIEDPSSCALCRRWSKDLNEGGRRAKAVYTLITSAKLNDTDPRGRARRHTCPSARPSCQAHPRTPALIGAPRASPMMLEIVSSMPRRANEAETMFRHHPRTPKPRLTPGDLILCGRETLGFSQCCGFCPEWSDVILFSVRQPGREKPPTSWSSVAGRASD